MKHLQTMNELFGFGKTIETDKIIEDNKREVGEDRYQEMIDTLSNIEKIEKITSLNKSKYITDSKRFNVVLTDGREVKFVPHSIDNKDYYVIITDTDKIILPWKEGNKIMMILSTYYEVGDPNKRRFVSCGINYGHFGC